MNGNYTVSWDNGNIIYQGPVRANKLEGQGVMTFENGGQIKEIRGIWQGDELR